MLQKVTELASELVDDSSEGITEARLCDGAEAGAGAEVEGELDEAAA